VALSAVIALLEIAPGGAQTKQTNDQPTAQRPANNQGFKEVPSTLATPKAPLPTIEELLKKDPKAAVEAVAEILGMVRGPRRGTTSVNIIEYIGTGTMSEPEAGKTWRDYKLTHITMDLDFVIPAARVQIERSGPDGRPQRQIQVVAAKQAWNEEKPGINGTSMTGASEERVRQIWLSPQGAMWAALRASEQPGNVHLANEGGRLTISFSLSGEPTKMFLNSALLPEKVQIQARSAAYGAQMLQATYSGYKDFYGYLLQCPRRMTYAAGDHTILDLNVTECIVNPYVIFPMPGNMAKASQ
jgi:hypothetical protein